MKKIAVLSMLLLCGCQKFLEVDKSPNMIENEAVYSNEANALAALNGIYVQMRNSNLSFANGAMSIYLGLYTDELTYSLTNVNYQRFYANAVAADNSAVNSVFWNEPYHLIYRINSMLEGISKSTMLAESFKNQAKGELLFLRSFIYFYLTQLFGDVPLVLTTDYEANQYLPRNVQEDILRRLIKDLEDAYSVVGTDYPSAGKARPNKDVLAAFMARVYLTMGNWDKALQRSEQLINAKRYPLLQRDLKQAFVIGASETIWEIASKNESANSSEGINFIPARPTAAPTFTVSDRILSLFDAKDSRLRDWLGANIIAGVSYYYPNKYKNRSTTAPVTEYNVVLRMPEQYLIAAEACLQLGDAGRAIGYINKIRERAGIVPIAASINIEALHRELLDERERELFAEWGHRWLDLKRNKLLDATLSPIKPNWKKDAALFPIPINQLNTNTNLKQNPGY